jgi:hypothetical protein
LARALNFIWQEKCKEASARRSRADEATPEAIRGYGDDDIFAQDGEPDEIRCGEDTDGLDNDVVHADPPSVPGGESSDTFLDASCEIIVDTVN